MASSFKLEVVTPYRKFFDDNVEMVVFKMPDGEIGILPGHEPMVVAISSGPMRILQGGQWKTAAITEGFAEIKQDQTILVADSAEWPEEIDVQRAQQAMERAEKRLSETATGGISEQDITRSIAALQRAITRLRVKGH